VTWLARGLLVVAGIIAGWFVARDALDFGVVQGVVAMLLFGLAVLGLALWPRRWTARLGRLLRR